MESKINAVDFNGATVVIANNQSEYINLPASVSFDGCVTTFWKPTFIQKIKILFGGIWLQILTFDEPLQPLKMLVSNPLPRKNF